MAKRILEYQPEGESTQVLAIAGSEEDIRNLEKLIRIAGQAEEDEAILLARWAVQMIFGLGQKVAQLKLQLEQIQGMEPNPN